jgi:transcriptional regulator with XRE-family HTH domain
MTKRKKAPTARELLAANVRRLREQTEVSQERLAEMAGFHRTYVSQVERGIVNITVDNIDALAATLKVPVHILLCPVSEDDVGKAKS